MADCGATGSALDRAASALASTALGNGSSAADATAAAGRAVASLLGKTAATSTNVANGVGGGGGAAAMGGGALMPSAAPDRLYLPGHAPPMMEPQARRPVQPVHQSAQHQHGNKTMDEAWNGSGTMMAGPPPSHPQHHQHHPMAGNSMMPPHAMHPHAAAMAHRHRQMQMAHHHHSQMQQQQQMQMNMNMMAQQQQQQQQHHQMMMMQQQQQQQQMAMQQQQQQQKPKQYENQKQQSRNGGTKQSAASSVSRAKQQQQQQQDIKSAAAATQGKTEATTSTATNTNEETLESWHDGLEDDFLQTINNYRTNQDDNDDDVKTVGNDDEYDDDGVVGHEGYVEGAGIEELAAAWAEAEAEAEARAGYAGSVDQDQTDGYEYDPTDMASAYNNDSNAYGEFDTVQAELDGEITLAPYDFGEASATHPDETTLQNTDFMAEGMKHFDAGNIPEAIRAFETELRHVDADNSDAWRMLGRCHAENDEDRKAIACLERAVDRDPYSVEALLALGTSYVNELDHARALRSLKAWATHNPMYAGMELPEISAEAAATVEERERQALNEAKKLLQTAMEFDPTQAADAMEALGVVCNVSREYDAAINYFRKAIEVRPDDYQLYNKLGATLANSNRSDEALPAYHKALQLKPRYARAWLNMAISHANLHNYEEAARCYLQTLSLNPSATHVWSYLRIALTCAERWDLLPLSASQNIAEFKKHFDFVQY